MIPGGSCELELVNQIRPRVQVLAEANYPGVTSITRNLLGALARSRSARSAAFFFCQLEAIETFDLAQGKLGQAQYIPTDGGPFSRWCAKMATGSGKTIVMAMVVAWQVLNKTAYPDDARFSKHVLAIAPGLTVRNRLQVLVPDSPGNYYDEFNIVPARNARQTAAREGGDSQLALSQLGKRRADSPPAIGG